MKSAFKICLFFPISLFLLSFQLQASVITTNLVGYWSGDGHANDGSVNANHGTLQNGASFRTGVSGQAFDLDGSNDWVSTAFTIADDQSHTISAWVYLDGMAPNTHQEIVSWWNLTTPIQNRSFLGISNLPGQGPIRFGDAYQSVPGSIPVGQWAHVLASYDGATNDRNVYVNGVLVGSLLASDEAQFFTTMAIGRQGDGAFEYWNGGIDELAIYDTVLNHSQIQQLAGNAVPEPSTYALMLFGLMGLGMYSYKRRTKTIK